MGSFFYNLGKRVGPEARKGRWVWSSLTGSEAEARRAERAVGRDLAVQMRDRLGIDDDPRDRRLVEEIGFSLVRRLRKRDRRFSFEPLREGGANAVALPGGFVFVTRGLLDACGRDRDELAFVLAHEIGHVVRGHALERVVGRSALAGVIRALPAVGLLGGLAGRAGLAFLETSHSREQEQEADALGIRHHHRGGDPLQGLRPPGRTCLESVKDQLKPTRPASSGPRHNRTTNRDAQHCPPSGDVRQASVS